MSTNRPRVCLVGITLATVIQVQLPYMVLESPTLPYKAMGIPKTGQGIQCRVMEYTFCHFIIIIANTTNDPIILIGSRY